jgi:hypothetical protein
MLNAQELRLGNWVQETNSKGKTFYAKMNIDFLETLLVEPDIFDPIPLTPEILERCGFVKHEKFDFYKNYIALSEKFQNNWVVAEFNRIDGQGHLLRVSFSSLHQLQNLYFSLTGQELTVNIETVESGDIEIAE